MFFCRKSYLPFIAGLIFSVQTSIAQKEGLQYFKNPLFPTKINTKSFDSSELKKLSFDDLINYFVEKRKAPSYKYISKSDNKTWIVTINDPAAYFDQEIKKSLIEQRTPYSNNKFFNLLQRIKNLTKVEDDFTENAITNNIIKEIESFPPSNEKVFLLIAYSNTQITNDNYYKEIEKTYITTNKIVGLISDKFEKAVALLNIGDYLSGYQNHALAISAYFTARELVYNCNKSDSIKNIFQGRLCEQIANVFYSETIGLSNIKCLEYLLLAQRYYALSGHSIEPERTSLNALGILLFNYNQLLPFAEDSALSFNNMKVLLYGLKLWLDEYDERPKDPDVINYYGFYCIAVACRNSGKYSASINYFLEALYYAIKLKNYVFVRSSISNISSMYGDLNNWKEADSYVNLLALFTANFTSENVFNSGVQHAQVYNSSNKLDSALYLINKIQFDTALLNNFFPPVSRKKYQEVYDLKFIILSKMKNDSADIYENYCHRYQEIYQDIFSSVLKQESKSISEWLERQGENELIIREELIKFKEENNKILSGKNILLDSLVTFNELLAEERKKLLESEKKGRSSDSLYYNDSLASSNKIRDLERRNNLIKIENERKTRNYIIAGLLILGITVFSITRYKNKINKERDKLRQANEIARINNLVRNNIHNYKNDYATFGNLIAKGDLNKLSDYNQHYGDYLLASYENWKEGKQVTLFDELEAGKSYFLSKKVRNPEIELYISSNSLDVKKILFLQSVFDTLIHNSIKHGFKNISFPVKIEIDIIRENEYLVCSMVDNGTPPSNEEAYFKRSDSGLNLLKKRVENLYIEKKLVPPLNSFSVSIRPERKGTNITFRILYNET